MKKFRFPLRPVAVLRAHRELRAREAFAVSVHAYVATEERLAATRTRVAELGRVLFDGRSGRFLAADAASLFRVYRAECEAEMAAEREVIAAREAMHLRRQEYLEANRHLKIVQRLEEKARADHRAGALRDEQVALDEFAGYASARRPVLT
ncbi:MAG: flagellar export protein FliJ [Opitutales bacterium]